MTTDKIVQEDAMIASEITQKVLQSRKYAGLDPVLVHRVVEDCIRRFGEKRALKETKNLLHQVWGAYFPKQMTYSSQLTAVQNAVTAGKDLKEILTPILELHSSTAERLPFLDEFYRRIFTITGVPKSVIDWGCGLNPLTIPWMNLPQKARYDACDIDRAEISFLNRAASLLKFPVRFRARVCDIARPTEAETLAKTDVVFMLKLFPVLEQQRRGLGEEVISRQNARFVVVSFPAGGLSGRKRQMGEFYDRTFAGRLGNGDLRSKSELFDARSVLNPKKGDLRSMSPLAIAHEKIVFPQEVVFILKMHPSP